MNKEPKQSTPSTPKSKVAILVSAAALAIAPFTVFSEGTKYKAYLDPAKIPTICNGKTKGVKLGDTATPAECAAFLEKEMIEHMEGAVRATPEITENKFVLMAAGDFAYNAGVGAYASSPMAVEFRKRNWTKGCNAFIGHRVGATFDRPQPRYRCRTHPLKKGKQLCDLPGLVTRRINQQKICLTGRWK